MFTNLLDAFKANVNLGVVIVSALLIFNTVRLGDIEYQISDGYKHASTAYAYNVVAYGLKDATTDEEVVEDIMVWHNDKWGAQIGALTTLCRIDPDQLHGLMSPETAVKVCRVAKY